MMINRFPELHESNDQNFAKNDNNAKKYTLIQRFTKVQKLAANHAIDSYPKL